MKDLLKQYLPYLSVYKKHFFFAILGMIAVAVGTTGTAQLIKPVLDDVFINKDVDMLALMPFLLVGVFMLKGIGTYIQTYYTSYIGQDVVRKLRDKLVSHITYLDMGFFKHIHTGEILSRVTNDISRIQMVVANIIPDPETGEFIFEAPVGEYELIAEGEEIEMTAPVSQEAISKGTYRVAFVMPSSFTLETLPKPKDERIKIRKVPAKKVAVIQYSGTWSEENYDEHEKELFSFLSEKGYKIVGTPLWARYDPPFMPWLFRRNEIMVEVAN